MEILNIQENQVIAKRKDKVKEWYLIQEGTVIQKFDFAEISLEKNAIIGILASDCFPCDYIAKTDAKLAAFSCENYEDLKRILANQEKLRSIFLKTAFEQRHQMYCIYADLQIRVRQFHTFIETVYNNYLNLCGQMEIDTQAFPRIENFKALAMKHKAEKWEINSSIVLMKNYLLEYIRLMEKDDSLSIGAIMEASAQIRRVTLGISEMENYLLYNKDILLSESENDIFHLFFDLAVRAGSNNYDVEPVKKEMEAIIDFIKKIKIYDERLVQYRVDEYENYDLDRNALVEFGTVEVEDDISSEEAFEERKAIDYLAQILTFAGMEEEKIEDVRKKINAYRKLPDVFSTENEAYTIRKQLIPVFYEAYEKIFFKIVRDGEAATLIVKMFLNFGFMDAKLAGEDNLNAFYDLSEHLELFQSDHTYTIFRWLESIYKGENEPSRNEFDLDYPAYVADLRKNGDIKQNEVQTMLNNQEEKVKFEIKNMFTVGNRITYGKVTSFCPMLGEYDLISSLDKMLVTVEKLDEAINEIRKLDYSVFYRETIFSDPSKDILREVIKKEVLPIIILMPNAGTRAMMWQETAGAKRDTPARFLFPIFTVADIDEMMLETVGRFRWEICRKEQGVHWNDIREKSLTSEFYDYIQYYRKNQELSADAREKIKTALVRARNNSREVFVKDYVNWMKYESKGSFRLNKVARDILARYCPFTKEVRRELKINSLYAGSIGRFEIQNTKKMQRIVGLYEKYKKAGGVITKELRDNLLFYQM